jgi:3-isopropylmalate/(R)-2-methylmalate dehydratase small subunit
MIAPITRITGTAVPMMRSNIDTDQIMPKQFLKRIERSGFGEFVFAGWRADGDFVLDDPAHAGASVLIAGKNFGCGSSREQAVWGLLDHGVDAVVAPSFAPIFRQNAARSRLLTVDCPWTDCERLAALATDEPSTRVVIEIAEQRLTMGDVIVSFELDPRTLDAFLLGMDEIERTLAMDDAISSYERRRSARLPTTIRS